MGDTDEYQIPFDRDAAIHAARQYERVRGDRLAVFRDAIVRHRDRDMDGWQRLKAEFRTRQPDETAAREALLRALPPMGEPVVIDGVFYAAGGEAGQFLIRYELARVEHLGEPFYIVCHD